jgi:putative ABC transport system permease protein
MFPNFFRVAIRNLTRNKAFSAINILGLALGMASALLIGLWIQNELRIDRAYPKTDRLALLYNHDVFSGETIVWDQTPPAMTPVLKKEYPAVEDAARFANTRSLLTVGDVHLNNDGGIVDSGFLAMFGFTMLEGDPKRALSGDYNIVLTQQMAKRLFGAADPMGMTVVIDSNTQFTVTGILRDLPATTSFTFEFLIPWTFLRHLGFSEDQWGNNFAYTYVLLRPGITWPAFDKQVDGITRNHSKLTSHVFAQPMNRFHLYAKHQDGRLVGDKIITVRLFIIVAIFILLIACINFMNLSTARSERRAREVGIRKVAGAVRGSLIAQFIGESTFIALLAFLIALFSAQLCLSEFNQLVDKQLHIDYSSPGFWLFGLCFVLLTGLLAGSYPAFYLSSFRPVSVLKGSFKKVDALITPRKVLVVLQFSFAICLIICTAIITKQLRYGMDRDAGYNRDQLVYFTAEGQAQQHYDAIRQELLSSGAATAVTYTPGPITKHWNDSWGFQWPGSTKTDEQIDFLTFGAKGDFVKTMGITLLQGRDIDIDRYPSDSDAIVLNESAVKTMRLSNPIGQIVSEGAFKVHIIGVIRDFILESPYTQKIAPMMIFSPKNANLQVVTFRLNPAHPTAANLAVAEKIYKKYSPAYPFEYNFTDEAYAKKFKAELQTTKLSALFAGLTIFISCLGLFALAAYMAENRNREIGVRKVLGASVTSITTLLARQFVALVLVAFLIAVPVAWFAMEKWLLDYSYRISIGWEVFAVSGLAAVLIAVATVSYQSIKAAIANPVKSLRTE